MDSSEVHSLLRSRQKNCTECVLIKRRCDRRTPTCSRCAERGTFCTYVSNKWTRRAAGTNSTFGPCPYQTNTVDEPVTWDSSAPAAIGDYYPSGVDYQEYATLSSQPKGIGTGLESFPDDNLWDPNLPSYSTAGFLDSSANSASTRVGTVDDEPPELLDEEEQRRRDRSPSLVPEDARCLKAYFEIHSECVSTETRISARYLA